MKDIHVSFKILGPLFDWIEDSHAFEFYLQGISQGMCVTRNYILYSGK